jgi:hypothetical protein
MTEQTNDSPLAEIEKECEEFKKQVIILIIEKYLTDFFFELL